MFGETPKLLARQHNHVVHGQDRQQGGDLGPDISSWSPAFLVTVLQPYHFEVLSAVRLCIFLFSMVFCTADITIAISLILSPSLEKS